LFQTFREPPDIPANELLPMLREIVEDETGLRFSGVHWNARQRRQQSKEGISIPATPKMLLPDDHAVCEFGIKYLIDVPAPGRDPNLYLDFRAARRWLRDNCEGKTVLNAFAYTCGAGVASLAGGARSVTNLDFSETALGIGRNNAELNGLHVAEGAFECLCGDAVPALRMLAGLPVSADRRRGRGGGRGGGRGRGSRGAPDGRGGGRAPLKLRRRQFDVVVLDPPTWTKTKFGAVDLVRDYESLFKPSVLATRPGGTVLATNHVASVDIDEWLEKLEKCAKKADQPLSDLTVLEPEMDFPSPDSKHPLKIAIAKVENL
jgi:23S rRNA (cytosine1962-C5)-methyltransferase